MCLGNDLSTRGIIGGTRAADGRWRGAAEGWWRDSPDWRGSAGTAGERWFGQSRDGEGIAPSRAVAERSDQSVVSSRRQGGVDERIKTSSRVIVLGESAVLAFAVELEVVVEIANYCDRDSTCLSDRELIDTMILRVGYLS